MSLAQRRELRRSRWAKLLGRVHDPDFHYFRNLKLTNPKILDIGANRGQSIVSFKKHLPDSEIRSFEANPYFWPVLERLAAEYADIEVKKYGLGSIAGELIFYIPVVDGIKYLQEGSTRIDYFDKPWVKERITSYGVNFYLEEMQVHIEQAHDSIAGERIDIVKIDVEGAEYDVVSSMSSALKENFPILLIENSDFENVTSLLSSLDYMCFQYIRRKNVLVELKESCTNTFYIHKSAIDNLPRVG
jgi:FkbM family methyltransferase